MPKTIRFEVETITPMFLSGADQRRAELRAPGIKGLLRFWWRALHPELTIENLKKKENTIFGSGGESGSGGSSFSLHVTAGPLQTTKEKFPKHNIMVTSKSRGRTFPVNILEYLAYGTYEYKRGEGNVFLREWIKPGAKFYIDMTFFKEEPMKEVLRAMYIFSLFGGIGSRSRNGFGGFFVVNETEAFKDLSTFISTKDTYGMVNIAHFIKKIDDRPFTSFTQGTKLFRSRTHHTTWDSALADIGKIYRSARENLEAKHNYDKRQYIGAPIIVDRQDKSFLERHSKPYFLRVVREGSQYYSYILYLPSLYAQGLEVDQFGRRINHTQVNEKFKNICDEMNRYLSNEMEIVL